MRRVRTPSRIALLLLLVEIAIAVAAPLVAPYPPDAHHSAHILHAPSARFPLGTDHLGRDVLSRLIFGTRELLLTLAVALLSAFVVGGAIALFTLRVAPFCDAIITLLLDVALVFPIVLLAMILINSFGATLLSLAFTLSIAFMPIISRHIRAVGKELMAEQYVEAVRSAGGTTLSIIIHHIIPSLVASLYHFIAVIAVLMIAISSALSFLGLARRPPTPDWGLMLRDGRSYLLHAPWMVLAPGIAIMLTGLLFYSVGENLQRAHTLPHSYI